MTVRHLKLTQFRNYQTAVVDFHPNINVLTGMNGMGKTNILDALYYLGLGKSYFASGDKTVIMLDKDFFRVEGAIERGDRTEIVVIKVQSGKKKVIEISGKKLPSIGDFIGEFPVVMIAPDDVGRMLESSENRRNFINNTIVQTDKDYLKDLLLYNALLKRRNTLLKTFAKNNNFDKILLDSYTEPMFGPAKRIYEKRAVEIQKMVPVFNEIYGQVSGKSEFCTIEYKSELKDTDIEELIRRNLEKDRILTRTSTGIHKDDLIFSMNDQLLKDYASQGQLKSFVLSLKISQYRILESATKTKPILLLDDIFDKLDKSRVKHLLALLSHDDFGQVFITDTVAERLEDILNDMNLDFKMFHVKKGELSTY